MINTHLPCYLKPLCINKSRVTLLNNCYQTVTYDTDKPREAFIDPDIRISTLQMSTLCISITTPLCSNLLLSYNANSHHNIRHPLNRNNLKNSKVKDNIKTPVKSELDYNLEQCFCSLFYILNIELFYRDN